MKKYIFIAIIIYIFVFSITIYQTFLVDYELENDKWLTLSEPINRAFLEQNWFEINNYAKNMLFGNIDLVILKSKYGVEISYPIESSFNLCKLSFERNITKYGISLGEIQYCRNIIKIIKSALMSPVNSTVLVLLIILLFSVYYYKLSFELKYKIATQVAHDIKSPLMSLKTALEHNNNELSIMAIDQISSIADNLLIKNKKEIISAKREEKLELTKLINNVLKLKRIEKNDINIKLTNTINTEDIYINVNESELMRIISNLLNNAYEYSNKKEIELLISHNDLMVDITISDQGIGFSKDQLAEFSCSHKILNPIGNGIGLQSSYDYIQKLGGKIVIANKINQSGAIVCVSLPIANRVINYKLNRSVGDEKQIILIDDNILIGKSWMLSAKDMVKVSFYKSVSEFKKHIEKFDLNTPIYIDSDLGDSVSGDQASKEFFNYGFKNISLVTGYDKGAFSDKMPWIKEIRGKEFPSELLA